MGIIVNDANILRMYLFIHSLYIHMILSINCLNSFFRHKMLISALIKLINNEILHYDKILGSVN